MLDDKEQTRIKEDKKRKGARKWAIMTWVDKETAEKLNKIIKQQKASASQITYQILKSYTTKFNREGLRNDIPFPISIQNELFESITEKDKQVVEAIKEWATSRLAWNGNEKDYRELYNRIEAWFVERGWQFDSNDYAPGKTTISCQHGMGKRFSEIITKAICELINETERKAVTITASNQTFTIRVTRK